MESVEAVFFEGKADDGDLRGVRERELFEPTDRKQKVLEAISSKLLSVDPFSDRKSRFVLGR